MKRSKRLQVLVFVDDTPDFSPVHPPSGSSLNPVSRAGSFGPAKPLCERRIIPVGKYHYFIEVGIVRCYFGWRQRRFVVNLRPSVHNCVMKKLCWFFHPRTVLNRWSRGANDDVFTLLQVFRRSCPCGTMADDSEAIGTRLDGSTLS